MERNNLKVLDEEIIFQIKINRKEETFELIKSRLSAFEQSDFILYLEGYLNVMKEMRMNEIKNDYDLSDEEIDE